VGWDIQVDRGPDTEAERDSACRQDSKSPALERFGFPVCCVTCRAVAEDSIHFEALRGTQRSVRLNQTLTSVILTLKVGGCLQSLVASYFGKGEQVQEPPQPQFPSVQ